LRLAVTWQDTVGWKRRGLLSEPLDFARASPLPDAIVLRQSPADRRRLKKHGKVGGALPGLRWEDRHRSLSQWLPKPATSQLPNKSYALRATWSPIEAERVCPPPHVGGYALVGGREGRRAITRKCYGSVAGLLIKLLIDNDVTV